jgi:hypothetical protein
MSVEHSKRNGPASQGAQQAGQKQTQKPSPAVAPTTAVKNIRAGTLETNEKARPRELFEGFITTLRYSDVLNSKRGSGTPENFLTLALNSQKLEKPLRQFLEEFKRSESTHSHAISLILERSSKLEQRAPKLDSTIIRGHPKRYVWEDINAKIKTAPTVTALLELLKEPAAQREPVIEALKAWANPPSLGETLKGMFSPSPKLRVCRFAASLLENLNIK